MGWADDSVARCITCGYPLWGLRDGACPECGRAFDPDRPETYLTRPPFILWRYWAPGLLLSILSGLALIGFFSARGQFGMGLMLGLPFSIGALMGYGTRFRIIALVIAVTPVLCAVVFLAMSLGLVGVYCGIIGAFRVAHGAASAGVEVSVRGVWTARFVPRFLVRLWLWWVLARTRQEIGACALRRAIALQRDAA